MEIKDLLKAYKTIAIIGCSRDPNKDSYKVASYLIDHDYNVILINPNAEKILGKKAYKDVFDLPKGTAETINIIDIFRPNKEIENIIRNILKFKDDNGKNLKVIWLQDNLFLKNDDLKEQLQEKEITLIENDCIMREHSRWLLSFP